MKKRDYLVHYLVGLLLVLPSVTLFGFARTPPPPPPVPAFKPPGTSFQQVVSFVSLEKGKNVSVAKSHGENIRANRDRATSWGEENFIINGDKATCGTLKDGAKINIRTTAGYYFSAQPQGALEANRVTPKKWETFTLKNLSNPGGCLEDGDEVRFKTYHGNYIAVHWDWVNVRSQEPNDTNGRFYIDFIETQTLETGDSEDLSFPMQADYFPREFDVYIPEDLNQQTPLLIDLHGINGNKNKAKDKHGFRELAEKEGFIGIWPSGREGSWNGVVCCLPASGFYGLEILGEKWPDVEFIRALVFWVAMRANVDMNRVYVVGHSNGGALAHQLGLRAADIFAGVAAAAFPLTETGMKQKPSEPVAVLNVFGWQDTFAIFALLGLWGTVEDGFHDWGDLNGCEWWPKTTRYWDLMNWQRTYQRCNGAVTVEMLKLAMGHESFSGNKQGVDVTKAVWTFLSRHSK